MLTRDRRVNIGIKFHRLISQLVRRQPEICLQFLIVGVMCPLALELLCDSSVIDLADGLADRIPQQLEGGERLLSHDPGVYLGCLLVGLFDDLAGLFGGLSMGGHYLPVDAVERVFFCFLGQGGSRFFGILQP
ncbi:hypothetical protein BD293_3589 [Roseinatronobacter monicus]|uniref:Uncharacterized protein n=1 Tax=Roseinatronobacter monicus TaxID=393481 RepID=A0A543KII3_9RHOB|nr:hypothetical protein BD293_3589 [Roseinatronobacter monicus]